MKVESKSLRSIGKYMSDFGGVLTESAISLSFIVVFFIVPISALSPFLYRSMVLQYTANEAARWASIGVVQDMGNTLNSTPYSAEQVRSRIINVARKFHVSVDDSNIHFCQISAPTCVNTCAATHGVCTVGFVPNTGEDLLVRISVPLTFIPSFGSLPINARAIARRE